MYRATHEQYTVCTENSKQLQDIYIAHQNTIAIQHTGHINGVLMSYKQQPTDTGVAKDHEEHFPEPLIRNVKLVGENFEEGNVEEGSTSNTLEQPVTYVLRKAGGKVGHGNTNTNPYRA